jgi:3-oxoadipate enol-lactonase
MGLRRPPKSRQIDLSEGRRCRVRILGTNDAAGPPILLLHGWIASAGLNWHRAFAELSEHHFVVAPDLPGHAGTTPQDGHRRSPLSSKRSRFDIERSADDIAELLDELEIDQPVIVVGYSLGGMVAQMLWRRYPERVAGLVLGATSAAPVPVSRGRLPLAGVMHVARGATDALDRLTHHPRRLAGDLRKNLVARLPSPLNSALNSALREIPSVHWVLEEFTSHHWPTVLDAGRAIAHFDAREWIGDIDVPTSVIMTERDTLIPLEQQEAMVAALDSPHVETMDAGHLACVRSDFAETLLSSCRAVKRRIAANLA